MSTIRIHPTAIVDETVKLSKNVIIGPYCVIKGHTEIGKNTIIYSHSVIGTQAEHKSYWNDEPGKTVIGSNCVIREFTTINAGTIGTTTLEDNVIMLRGSHVGHDAYIEKFVTLSCNVLIGGHARIFRGANLGLGAVVHQHCAVGHYSMIGMNATVTKKSKIEALRKYVGTPARYLGENKIAFEKFGFTSYSQKYFNHLINTWKMQRAFK